jgi:RNA polymerase sigma-70 factor (ECF subfamily)
VRVEELDTLPDGSFSPEFLLAQIAKGDKKSEQELITRHWRGLYFILYRRTKDPDLAADLAQDTFVIVIDKARNGGIENPSVFSGFIRQVGINLMNAHYRKEKRRSTDSHSDIDVHIPDNSPTLYQQLEAKNMLGIVEQLLDELTVERDRQILKHYFIYEKDKSEICQYLELSPEHFDRVLQRARARLKQLVFLKLGSEPTGKVASSLFNTTLLVLAVMTSLLFSEGKEHFFDRVVREIQNQRHFYLYVSAKSVPSKGSELETGDKQLEYYCYG